MVTGGWTGWSEQPIQSVTDKMVTEDNFGRDEEGEEHDETSEGEDADEDESTLLAKLGLSSIDAGKELEVKDVGVWERWALEERKRGSEQWLPVHGTHTLSAQSECRLCCFVSQVEEVQSSFRSCFLFFIFVDFNLCVFTNEFIVCF